VQKSVIPPDPTNLKKLEMIQDKEETSESGHVWLELVLIKPSKKFNNRAGNYTSSFKIIEGTDDRLEVWT
jgi:hypothetical protein